MLHLELVIEAGQLLPHGAFALEQLLSDSSERDAVGRVGAVDDRLTEDNQHGPLPTCEPGPSLRRFRDCEVLRFRVWNTRRLSPIRISSPGWSACSPNTGS